MHFFADVFAASCTVHLHETEIQVRCTVSSPLQSLELDLLPFGVDVFKFWDENGAPIFPLIYGQGLARLHAQLHKKKALNQELIIRSIPAPLCDSNFALIKLYLAENLQNVTRHV